MTEVTLTVESALATIVFDIPPDNRFTVSSIDALDAALGQIEVGDARALLLRSEGADFCAGAHTDHWPTETDRQRYEYFTKVMRVLNRLEDLPIPTVAAVQGLAASLGVEVAIRADVVFAGRSARYKHGEAGVGIVTMIGGVYRMAERVGRSKAVEWAYTGEETSADDLERFGAVNHVVDDDQLVASATAFAKKLSQGATLAFAAHKRLLRIWAASGIDAADKATAGIALPLFHTADAKAGVEGAAEARRTGAKGATWSFTGH